MKMMMKKLIPMAVLLAGTSAYAQYRIATVNLERVFTNYWKTKQAQIALDEKRAEIDSERKDRVAGLDKAQEDYQKLVDSASDPAVSSEERERRKRAAEDKAREINDMKEEYQQFARGAVTSMDEQIKRTRDNIVNEIRAVVNSRAKMDGYTMVINTAAQAIDNTPVILFSTPGDNDITDAVIKQINAGAPAETPKADEKPAGEAVPKKDSK